MILSSALMVKLLVLPLHLQRFVARNWAFYVPGAQEDCNAFLLAVLSWLNSDLKVCCQNFCEILLLFKSRF